MDGIGPGQVNDTQAPLFLSLLPDPFVARASVLKAAARSMFGPAKSLTAAQRQSVRLRKAPVMTLLEAGSAGSGRVFHNLGPEGETALVAQGTPSADKDAHSPRLSGEKQKALHGLVVTKALGQV